MRTALIIGNGLTKSLLGHLQLSINTSNPMGWNLSSPISPSLPLIDDFPNLKNYIFESNQLGIFDDFEIFQNLVKNSAKSSKLSPLPSGSNEEQSVILDSGHFLALAYSWLQLKIDEHSLDDWEWAKWISANYQCIVGALSWNYDLVLERLIEHAQSPYFYTPAIPTPSDAIGIKCNRSAIPLSKPHGSCNFSPANNFTLSVGSSENGPFQPLSYPRTLQVTAFDGPIQVIRQKNLYAVRQVVDLVLPGEWNRFGQRLHWIDSMIKYFASVVQNVDQLIVVGFSMMASDQDEFLMSINRSKPFEKIVVVDPKPNPNLISILKNKTNNLQIQKTGVPN